MKVELYFAILLLSLTVEQINSTDGELLAVVMFYRHGDRSPLTLYPTDPYNETYWPMGLGQLTDYGKMQMYQLGVWLKERYGGFLTVDRSYVRSTDYDRTLMSAQCCLAGLFPPSDANQTWNDQLNWQPVPIHTVPLAMDAELAMDVPCERYDSYYEALLNTKKMRQAQEQNRAMYEYISVNSNVSIDMVDMVYDTLYVEDLHNLTLPDWTKLVYPEPIKNLASNGFRLATYTPQLARLKTGLLFNEMYNNIQNASRNLGPTMYMYSAHDVTIANILNSLNIFDPHIPTYSAVLLFELRSKLNRTFINIVYKNTSVPINMTLRGCEFDCPLEEFAKILGKIRLDYEDWMLQCSVSPTDVANILCGLFIGGFLISLAIYGILVLCKKKTEINYVRIPSTKYNL